MVKQRQYSKDNTGEYHDLRANKDFLNRMQNTPTTKEKTNKLDKIKIRNTCSSKEETLKE